MLRKHTRQEMAKASLWMHKNELQKIEELSGDMSLNVFLMQIIRKSLANELQGVIMSAAGTSSASEALGER